MAMNEITSHPNFPMSEIERLIQEWDGVGVVVRFDQPTGTWIFVALHDTTLGPAVGGCRMKVYPTPADGLRDAMRLARAMTSKWAVIDYPLGGGKSVLAVPGPLHGEERRGLFRRFGRLLESLRGSYATGGDLGTSPEDMAVIGEETRFVHGIVRETGETVDPGPFTALGVFTGIRAAVRHAFGDASLEGRTVLVQGVGHVGGPLVERLLEAGATVLISDLQQERLDDVQRSTGCRVVAEGEVFRTECDVFAPCAVGGVLSRETVPQLRCRIVAGAANNQLADDSIADQLVEQGIVYAPDYVVNAGGAIALPMFHQGATVEKIHQRIEQIGTTLAEILTEASERSESPQWAAARRVRRILDARAATA